MITGQDLPIKDTDYFINKLDTDKSYLQYTQYPVPHLAGGAKDWFEYYNFFDLLNAKKYMKTIRLLRNIQKKLRIMRTLNTGLPDLFYGSTYWSLRRELLEYILEYTRDSPKFLNRLKHTFCAEELYISSVLLNSPYTEKIMNDNLRYIRWADQGKTGSPEFLDEKDFSNLKTSDRLFARKFKSNIIEKKSKGSA